MYAGKSAPSPILCSCAALTLEGLKKKCSATTRRTLFSSSAAFRIRKVRKKLHITWNRLRKT